MAEQARQKGNVLAKLRGLFPSLREFLTAAQISEQINEQIFAVSSYKIFTAAFVLSMVCLSTFAAIQQFVIIPSAISNGYIFKDASSQTSDLQILDIRNGYTIQEVVRLLTVWGDKGRLGYVILEMIDMIVFPVAYRLAALVLLNNMVKSATLSFPTWSRYLKFLPAIPLYISKIDFIENFLHFVIIFGYQVDHSQGEQFFLQLNWWRKIIKISSVVNTVKWLVVKAGCVVFLWLWTVVRAGGLMKKSKDRVA